MGNRRRQPMDNRRRQPSTGQKTKTVVDSNYLETEE